jgi:hypothetical protein
MRPLLEMKTKRLLMNPAQERNMPFLEELLRVKFLRLNTQ